MNKYYEYAMVFINNHKFSCCVLHYTKANNTEYCSMYLARDLFSRIIILFAVFFWHSLHIIHEMCFSLMF